VLKVSQLLLQVIGEHSGLTLAALKKELGNAGYEVRRKVGRPAGEASRSEVKGTLLRVSGSDAAGYFRVWKIPKPKKKPGRPRLADSRRCLRRTPPQPRSRRRRRTRRQAAKKAREVWRRCTRVNAKARRAKPRARESVRARVKEEARAKVMVEGRGRPSKEDTRPSSREEKRPSSKLREEKKQEPEKPVKRTIQQPTEVKTDRASSGQGKARTKTSTKSEGPRNAVGNP
jgi:hypothetical protein